METLWKETSDEIVDQQRLVRISMRPAPGPEIFDAFAEILRHYEGGDKSPVLAARGAGYLGAMLPILGDEHLDDEGCVEKVQVPISWRCVPHDTRPFDQVRVCVVLSITRSGELNEAIANDWDAIIARSKEPAPCQT